MNPSDFDSVVDEHARALTALREQFAPYAAAIARAHGWNPEHTGYRITTIENAESLYYVRWHHEDVYPDGERPSVWDPVSKDAFGRGPGAVFQQVRGYYPYVCPDCGLRDEEDTACEHCGSQLIRGLVSPFDEGEDFLRAMDLFVEDEEMEDPAATLEALTPEQWDRLTDEHLHAILKSVDDDRVRRWAFGRLKGPSTGGR